MTTEQTSKEEKIILADGTPLPPRETQVFAVVQAIKIHNDEVEPVTCVLSGALLSARHFPSRNQGESPIPVILMEHDEKVMTMPESFMATAVIEGKTRRAVILSARQVYATEMAAEEARAAMALPEENPQQPSDDGPKKGKRKQALNIPGVH